MGERTKSALKIAVSLALLAILVFQIGPVELAAALGDARPGYLVVAMLTIAVDVVIRSYNWKRLLAARGDEASLPAVFEAFAVGGFFGFFLPSSLGPDAGRTLALARREDIPGARAASSIVMLNLTGIWGLGVVFLAGLGGLATVTGAPSFLLTLTLGAAAAAVSVPALLWVPGTVPAPSENAPRLVKSLGRFATALTGYRDVRGKLLPVFSIALLNQLFALCVFFLVFRANGIQISALYFPVLVPAVTLARLIPASVAGFGAEQAAVVIAFGWAGVSPAEAMAASLLLSLLNAIFIGTCGLYFAGENARALMVDSDDVPRTDAEFEGEDADARDGS